MHNRIERRILVQLLEIVAMRELVWYVLRRCLVIIFLSNYDLMVSLGHLLVLMQVMSAFPILARWCTVLNTLLGVLTVDTHSEFQIAV